MLTFLFALASIWTLFWLYIFIRNWGDQTPLIDRSGLCAICPKHLKYDSPSENPSAAKTVNKDSINNASSNVASTATTKPASDSTAKQPVADKVDKNDQTSYKPLFEKPEETDDLKIIKGIGLVMEKTLNDLGITTFKQLADFQQAEVKMVSEVLSESNAGFGDRIERDEWVQQAKDLVKQS